MKETDSKTRKEFWDKLSDEGKRCFIVGMELDRMCDDYDREQKLKKWRPSE